MFVRHERTIACGNGTPLKFPETELIATNNPLQFLLPRSLNCDVRWLYVCSFLSLQAIALFPIFGSTLPMLSDYPNHLARMHVLLNAGRVPELNQFYLVQWSIVPNLAMDAIVPILAKGVGLELAGKLFLALTFLLISGGTLALHYALHRRISPWPFAVFFFLYNAIFLFGVVNFLFGIGVAIWGITAWIIASREFKWWHLPMFTLTATLILLCHLSAFGFFALVVTAYECRRVLANAHCARAWRGMIVIFAASIVSLLLFLLFSPTMELQSFNLHELSLFDVVVAFLTKPFVFLYFFVNYSNWLDSLTLIVFSVLLIRGFFSANLGVHRVMTFSLIALGIVVVFMPPRLFGSELSDARLMIALAFVFIASTDLKPDTNARWRILMTFFLIGLFLIRMMVISNYWKEADAYTASATKALDQLPIGKRLFVAFPDDTDGSFKRHFGIFVPCLAIISRSAFVPSLYAVPGAQPVIFTPQFQQLRTLMPGPAIPPGQTPNWTQVLQDYDYVWVGENAKFAEFPSAKLLMIASHSRFQLYRVLDR